MAKDDGSPGDHPPSKRLREFRKLFNDYTNKGAPRKSAGRRSSASPASASPVESSPLSAQQRRSTSRTPRSRNRDAKSKGNESPTVTTPEKKDDDKPVPEAKELAKADDEEFENGAATSPSNLAKCRFKQRELQWKGANEEEAKTKNVNDSAGKKPYKSVDNINKDDPTADVAIRRKKSRATPKKGSRRKRTAGSASTSPAPFNPSAEALDDTPPPKTEAEKKKGSPYKKATGGGVTISPAPFNPSAEALDDVPPPKMEAEKGVRCRTKKTAGEPVRRQSPSAETVNELTTDIQEIDQTSKEFKLAIKLMEILKRNNLLENALFPAQNEVVKAFFEGGMRNPDNKILGLISKAMDSVLDAVFFRGEDLDCMIEPDLRTFIIDRSKSKPILLDVIISRPEFLPQSWGGRTVVLKAEHKEKK